MWGSVPAARGWFIVSGEALYVSAKGESDSKLASPPWEENTVSEIDTNIIRQAIFPKVLAMVQFWDAGGKQTGSEKKRVGGKNQITVFINHFLGILVCLEVKQENICFSVSLSNKYRYIYLYSRVILYQHLMHFVFVTTRPETGKFSHLEAVFLNSP